MLLERDLELRKLDDLLRTGAGHCAIVLVSGAVGTGKTELVETFLRQAAGRGALALSATRVPAEGRAFPHGILDQLMCQALAAEPDLFGAFRGLLDLQAGSSPAAQPPADSRLLLDGLAAPLIEVCAARPVVIAVDDLHDADLPSLESLPRLVRRMRQTDALFLLTESEHEQHRHPMLRTELLRQPGAWRIELAPLSPAGVEQLAAQRLGAGTAAEWAPSLYALTGGNPLLLNALAHDNTTLDESARPDRAEPVLGETFGQTILACLDRIGPHACALARALAVLDAGRPPALAGRAAGLDAIENARALADLSAIGLVTEHGLRSRQVGEAILRGIPAEDRKALRLTMARLLYDAGAPVTDVGRHLVQAQPVSDSWASNTLLAAARQALQAERIEPAIEFLESVVRTAARERERLEATVLLARTRWRLDPALTEAYPTRLGTALQGGRLPRRHAPFVLRLLLWHGRLPEAEAVLSRLRSEEDEHGGGLQEVTDWVRTCCPSLLGTDSPRHRQQPLRPGPKLRARAGRVLADVLTHGGDGRTDAVAERVLRAATLDDESLVWIESALLALVYADQPGKAVARCEEFLAEAARRGAPAWQAVLSAVRAEAALRLGDPLAAERHCRAAFGHLPPRSWGVAVGAPLGTLVLALTATGRFEDAEQWLGHPVPEALFDTRYGLHYRYARGQLHFEMKRFYAAIEDFTSCGRLMTRWGIDVPSLLPWRSALASVLVHLGKGGQAKRLTEEQLGLPGADRPRTRGISLRILAKTSELKLRPPLLNDALASLCAAGDQLETARAMAELGLTQRALGQFSSAEKLLAQAVQLADKCQAVHLRDAWLSTLPLRARPSAPAPPSSALSGAEIRVAALAAEGLTNRQIAEELKITTSTVEQHLTRVYRKLRISSRSELPAFPQPWRRLAEPAAEQHSTLVRPGLG